MKTREARTSSRPGSAGPTLRLAHPVRLAHLMTKAFHFDVAPL